ncbi:hypothetical protein K2173_025329 [Erythroxylum novogranatense]|uniref:Uncharacterized protein n=1 Tax=Erythroxylum novogranatense TaxID=1862640 RepID=A0AAV8UGW3_9ROSI|nr:hypothetical protein K2173_025329 [Erythroxylum novogranatense]
MSLFFTSFKEPSAPVASVKNIRESHASYLMSGKELSNLVTFVKGTQFDLVVLFDPFRHDLRLWKAYSFTLQSHTTFTEYQDLVEDLEVRLSSVPELE